MYNTPTAHRKSIGPTPQKNGRVLGIFDLLSPAGPTPSKHPRSTLKPIYPNSLKTPSKRRLDILQDAPTDDQENTPSTKRLKISPPTASKHASFFTPSARRTLPPSNHTPRSSRAGVSKLQFDDTPAFLKRGGQNKYILRNYDGEAEGATLENDESGLVSWSPMLKIHIRTKPAAKGLSALVRGLREMEEERLDEEMELLRELEGGFDHTGKPKARPAPSSPKIRSTKSKDVFMTESLAPEMPLGPDGENQDSESNDEELEGKGRDGKPMRVWKKRGQKRSTRMVVMKPSRAKWKPEPKWKGGQDEEDEVKEVVPETQLLSTISVGEGERDDNLLDMDEIGDEQDTTDSKAEHHSSIEETKNKISKDGKNKKSNPARKKAAAAASAAATAEGEKGEQRKKKKVAATANPNFRALKIRNKNSRAKSGRRFGRGR